MLAKYKTLAACSLLVFALSACSNSSTAPSGPTARDVFYHDTSGGHANSATTAATEGNTTAAAYRLELRRGDADPVSCDNRFTFKSGDALRLHIKVKEPLYCYVLTIGSTGEKAVLYPPSGEDNLLSPDTDCVVPPSGEMIFDDNAGTERLLIALMTKPITEEKALTLQGVAVDSSALTGGPAKVGDYSVLSSFGSKYELGKPVSGDGLVYVSNPSREKPLTIELALKHTKDGDTSTAAATGTASTSDSDTASSNVSMAEPASSSPGSGSSGASSAESPHCYGFIPPFMLKDLSARNPSNRSFERTVDRMQTLVREAPVDRATTIGGNGEREVYDAKGQEAPGSKVRFEGDPPTGKFETDTVYDFTGEVRSFYKEMFGRESIDGKGMKYVSTENYGQNFENAFWNGTQMTYGYPSSDSPFATFVLIDVCGHEITHGITENAQMFEYAGQSGALNESISDVFGELIKQKSNKTPVEQVDWTVGEGCWKPSIHGHGIRNMLHPGTAYDDPRVGKDVQPAHMKDYVKTTMDNGGVHINSGIPNRAFALFAKAVGGNAWEEPGKIWFEARAQSEHHPSFAQFAYHTIEAAKKLDFEDDVPKLEKAWDAVGVTPSSTDTDNLTPGHSQ